MVDKKKDGISNYDMTIYNIKRDNMFKGTILMCIIYAIFAFILIITAYISENVKTLLFERFLPFTLIYIIGTIIIIIFFVALIFTYKPIKVDDTSEYPRVSCPDYWKLEIVNDNDTKTLFDTKLYDNSLFKYRCVMDDKIFNKKDIFTKDIGYKLTDFGSNILNQNDGYAPDNNEKYKTIEEKNYFKYYNIYKNINDINNNSDKYKNIIDDDYYTVGKLKDQLMIASYAMNNYEKNNANYDKIHSTDYKSYNIKPIAWNYNSNNFSNVSPLSVIHANNISVLVDLNGLTYDKYIDIFGNKETNVHNMKADNTASTILGNVKPDKDNKILLYKSAPSINIANIKNIVDDTNIYQGYISTATTAAGDTTAVLSIKNETQTYNINPLLLFIYDNSLVKSNSTSIDPSKNIPLVCDNMYPAFLSYMDDKNDSKNKLRCAYSKLCGVSWSDMNCL